MKQAGKILSTQRRLMAVFAGGFCDTIARALLSPLIQGHLGSDWPYDILVINLMDALLLAFCTVLANATFLLGPGQRLFVNVGILGAYTTFSSLAMGDILPLTHDATQPLEDQSGSIDIDDDLLLPKQEVPRSRQ